MFVFEIVYIKFVGENKSSTIFVHMRIQKSQSHECTVNAQTGKVNVRHLTQLRLTIKSKNHNIGVLYCILYWYTIISYCLLFQSLLVSTIEICCNAHWGKNWKLQNSNLRLFFSHRKITKTHYTSTSNLELACLLLACEGDDRTSSGAVVEGAPRTSCEKR